MTALSNFAFRARFGSLISIIGTEGLKVSTFRRGYRHSCCRAFGDHLGKKLTKSVLYQTNLLGY